MPSMCGILPCRYHTWIGWAMTSMLSFLQSRDWIRTRQPQRMPSRAANARSWQSVRWGSEGPPPVLHRIYANWNWRWIPNWHPRSMFWTGKVHPFIFSILGLRHLRYSCLLSTTFLDREMSKSCSSQHELTATGSFPPSSRWHPDTGRCVEGCERGVWKRGLGLQHDSPWSHAVSQCCFKEQSMQMSALGYPDEVCMIPEEEW